jgi:hypothetical protein
MKKRLTIFGGLVIATQVSAAVTGDQLLNVKESNPKYANGVVLGMLHSVPVWDDELEPRIPEDLSGGQIIEIYWQYLDEHPVEFDYTAVALAALAWQGAFGKEAAGECGS